MLTITIELRIDYDTANKKIKEPVIIEKCKQMCAELITLAELTADRRKPQISMQAGDFFATTEDVKLFDGPPE